MLVFRNERDARRVFRTLPKRFGKFGLSLHPEKTKLLDFRCPPGRRTPAARNGDRETFDFLGFTHYWGRTRRGMWAVKRKTRASRFQRACRSIWEWCAKHRHKKVRWQHQQLSAKFTGHLQYYGIIGNMLAVDRFRYQVERAWQYWLNRRSQQRKTPWERFQRIRARYPLPKAKLPKSAHRRVANAW